MVTSKNQERTQVDPNREGAAIVVTNFNGLNTTSNPMTIPYEDSPVFTNVIVSDRGGVERRKGTQVLYEPTNSRGGVVIPVATSYGYNYLLTKDGTGINVLEINGNTAVPVISKSGVWSAAAIDVKPSFVTLAEPGVTRVLLCTGVNAPIQVRFDEFRAGFTLGSSSNTVTITDGARLKPHQLSNMKVYVDGVARTATTFTTNATNTVSFVLSGAALTAGPHIIDVISITWQWWAEAEYYYGDRFFDTVNRAHAKATDVHVAIPENLRDGMDPLLPTYPFLYPIDVLYWTGSAQAYATPITNLRPATAYQYTFSDGSQRLDVNAPANFAKSFVTFGVVDSAKATTIESMYLLRRRKLKFRGGANGIVANNIHVSVDGVQTTQRDTVLGTNGDYFLFSSGTSFTPVTVASNPVVDYISFAGGNPLGLPSDAVVRLTNREAIYAGSGCNNANNVYVDGGWVPAYGLGYYADYGAFSFPRVVEVYQQRLVFSGFPHNPLSVVMSAVSDSRTPGEFYAFFQQDAFTDQSTDPLDFVVNSTAADDFVTALAEHQGSLFVGTSLATYRAAATGRTPIEASNVYVSTVSNTGPLNADCVAKTETTVLFLTRKGLYAIQNGSTSQEATEYTLEEISTPIHDLFKAQPTYLERIAWCKYNVIDDAVYIGLASSKSTQVATRLFRFGVFRASWSEYTTVGGWNTYGGSVVRDSAGNNRFIYVCARTLTSGVPSNLTYLTDSPRLLLDYVRTATSTGTAVSLTYTARPTTVTTIIDDVRIYPIGFDTIPIGDVYDIEVTVGSVVLTPEVDYIKTERGEIYLHYGVPGETLTIRYKNPSRTDGNHYVVYADNVEQLGVTTTITRPSGTVITYGTTYPSVFSTPLFTWGTLFGNKKLLYWAGLFDNQPILDRWKYSDLNLVAGQSVASLVDSLKTRADCSISFVYDSDGRNVNTASDLYNYVDYLTTDVGSAFDTDIPMQSEPEVLVKQSLQGVGYSFRCVVWECSDASFALLSYQIDAKQKGKKNRHWSE
jgi:hypothetical protein